MPICDTRHGIDAAFESNPPSTWKQRIHSTHSENSHVPLSFCDKAVATICEPIVHLPRPPSSSPASCCVIRAEISSEPTLASRTTRPTWVRPPHYSVSHTPFLPAHLHLADILDRGKGLVGLLVLHMSLHYGPQLPLQDDNQTQWHHFATPC